MFLRNCWYVAAWSDEISSAELFTRKLLGESIVFYRSDDGRIAALEDRCCHRFAPLSRGRREDDRLRCMYHGLVFDASGKCVEVPGETAIRSSLRVQSYPVIERDKFIWIWMGEPALADPEKIHPTPWHEHPDWLVSLGNYIHFGGNFELLADNLLDLSHSGYLHSATIGGGNIALRRPKTQAHEDAMSTRHTNPGDPRPVFAAKVTKLPEVIDRIQSNTWFVKGNYFTQASVMAPAGEGETSTDPSVTRFQTTIVVTPESERTSHYFWSFAHNRFATDEPNATALLAASVERAFEQDREMIEGQQRNIDERGEAGQMAISVDGPFMQVRRMLRRLLEEERRPAVSLEAELTT